MRYDEYTYLWLPRPEQKIAKPLLGFYEERGYWAQTKKNGTATMIFARGKEVIFKTRHNDDHKAWTPKADHVKFFAGRDKWNVYCAELLHSKTPHIKDTLFIFDQLVSDGEHLTGKTFAERQGLLSDLEILEDCDDQYRLDDRIYLAKCFNENFAQRYDHLKPEDEGLVLKDPDAKLRLAFKEGSNSEWQAKCRITHKNYSY